jgi:hypothetical protein
MIDILRGVSSRERRRLTRCLRAPRVTHAGASVTYRTARTGQIDLVSPATWWRFAVVRLTDAIVVAQ